MTVRVDKTAGKICVNGVYSEATLCLYDIRGQIVEIKQATVADAFFDLPCCGSYVLVVTHSLHIPIVKKLVIE